jgi:uncharacterized cupin superfamily protein
VTEVLRPGTAVDAAAIDVATAPLPEAQVVDGTPATGDVALGELGDTELGVWVMTPGVATDIEVDEAFVVLSGRARIDIAAAEGGSVSLEVGPGSLVRLGAGMATTWTVTETLRKVYLAR